MSRPSISLLILFLLCFASAVQAQYQNILIDNNASETTVAIDPLNTNHLVAGANLSNYYYSTDAGATWGQGTLTTPWSNAGDPNVASDGLGNFHYIHLVNSLDRIACQTTTVFPPSWSSGTYTGLAPQPFLQDHAWIYSDWDSHNLYVTWTQYDNSTPTSTTDSTHIMFSASYDHGNTWSATQRIDEVGGDLEYLDVVEPRAASGPDGTVYVSWESGQGILMDKSLDSGRTWMAHDQFVAPIPGGVYYSVAGINRIRTTPFICVDKSNGPNRGTIYINWCDQRNGLDNTDVWLVKSTDGGNTWSNAVRVNDDVTVSHQFLNAMAIDQTNGYLYVCFYDRRNYVSDTTDFYIAWSADGGNTFTNVQIDQQPFVVDQSSFFGDYIQMAAHNNVIRPVWAAFDAFGLSYVYTALIDGNILTSTNDKPLADHGTFRIYPSIVQSGATIDFNSDHAAEWRGTIYDLYGNKVKDLFSMNFPAGNHKLEMNASDLSPAVYLCQLSSGSEQLTVRFAVMR